MKTFNVNDRVVRGQFLKSGGKTLVVLVHGWCATGANMRWMSAEVGDMARDADRFIPELETGLLSYAKPQRLAERLSDDIAALDEAGAYDKVILVGHSSGALIARAAWLYAAGASESGKAEAVRHAWAANTERMVLMAAVNRGWSDSVAIGPVMKMMFGVAALWEFFTYGLFHGLLGKQVGTSGYILEMRRGAPFVTSMRLKWLAVARERGAPLTVQVLGTIDDIVSPKDNVDLITSTDFVYLEAPASGHGNMVKFDEPVAGKKRAKVFRQALTDTAEDLKNASVTAMVADDLNDGLDDFDEEVSGAAEERAKVKRVVFVIHGIRDYGFWTKKVAGRAKKLAGGSGVCRTVTSSYGFFPMGPFIFKALRRRRVEWLMDQYVRAKALYPKAEFSYMGHSNGTALLAGAMMLCRAIIFDRIVFAGSVVRRDYDWKALKGRGQIGAVMNYVASDDIVVAYFPKFLQRLPGADLGSAGVDGFKPKKTDNPAYVQQVRYVRGGHGAALRETLWRQAALFLLGDNNPGGTDDPTDLCERDWRATFANEVGSWIAMPVIALIVVALGLLILLLPLLFDRMQHGIWPELSDWLLLLTPACVTALLFLLWVWFVKTVLTRL